MESVFEQSKFEWSPTDHAVSASLMKGDNLYSYIYKDQNCKNEQSVFLTHGEDHDETTHIVTTAMSLIHAGVSLMGSLDISDLNARQLINVIVSRADLKSDASEINIEIS